MKNPTSDWLVLNCPQVAGFEVPGDKKAGKPQTFRCTLGCSPQFPEETQDAQDHARRGRWPHGSYLDGGRTLGEGNGVWYRCRMSLDPEIIAAYREMKEKDEKFSIQEALPILKAVGRIRAEEQHALLVYFLGLKPEKSQIEPAITAPLP
ncbi:MAG: hypothetical protein H8M99_06995 [Gloeobacteraceae cyanobacterium ES-bin-144]|nr:hypothetical protein [Verrucomicrobiales bacterium]